MACLSYNQIFNFARDFEPGLNSVSYLAIKARKYVVLIHNCILREFSPAYINNNKRTKNSLIL